jgi:hypothetical protein
MTRLKRRIAVYFKRELASVHPLALLPISALLVALTFVTLKLIA